MSNDTISENFSSIKCVIFDLDGTLVNTIDDLGNACNYLLRNRGIMPEWTSEDYKSFVGNGAKLLVKRAFGNTLSELELDEQYSLFKQKYNEIMLDNAYVYDGMYEVVNTLKSNGIKLAVCTNKPDKAAKGMIRELFSEDTFDLVLGAADDLPKKPNTAMPEIILNRLNVTPEECVWIGDSSVDIESAMNIGCKCIAVTWGFRSYFSLVQSNPYAIINFPKEILKKFDFSIDN